MSSKKPIAEIDLSLTTEQIGRIVGFLGYGNLCAPVWFIGIEEGLGLADNEEAISNLRSRTTFEPVMDLRQAHLLLREKGHPIDIEHKDSFTQVWEYMGKILRARRMNEDWQQIDAARDYVRGQLGRFNGETLLTELSSIPSKGGKDKTWIQWFKKHDPDLDTRIKRRTNTLKEMLIKYDPPLVVCYGDGNNLPHQFADLLSVKWETVPPRVRKSADSRRLLLPFFGQGHMSHNIIQTLLDHRLLGYVPNAARG